MNLTLAKSIHSQQYITCLFLILPSKFIITCKILKLLKIKKK
jgi:hypothetical protein